MPFSPHTTSILSLISWPSQWMWCKGPISLAWRLGGDSSLRWLRRCLRDVSWRLAGSPGSRGKFKHVQFFGRLFPVSSRSRRRLRDVTAQAMFWSPESPRLISLGSRGDVSLVRAQAIFLVSRVARVAATDQSRRRLRQWDRAFTLLTMCVNALRHYQAVSLLHFALPLGGFGLLGWLEKRPHTWKQVISWWKRVTSTNKNKSHNTDG